MVVAVAGRVARDDRVRRRPAAPAAVRLPGGAGAGFGARDAGGDAAEEAGVRQQVAARVADAPAVQLRLQPEAVAPHAGQHWFARWISRDLDGNEQGTHFKQESFKLKTIVP